MRLFMKMEIFIVGNSGDNYFPQQSKEIVFATADSIAA
jgi:hypothetical protein